jgi:hypothetical protein
MRYFTDETNTLRPRLFQALKTDIEERALIFDFLIESSS